MPLVPRGSFFDLDKVFDSFLTPMQRLEQAETGFFAPRVDIHEHADHYEISAELPGVRREDIHIELDDGILTITAETRREHQEERQGRVIRQERRYGKYLRSFNLGQDIQDADISASFENGILKLTAPKVTEAKPRQRRIEIR
ncbi:MAG: Hsp20/alpha crystallin family protein [Pseudomonadota bacterium]